MSKTKSSLSLGKFFSAQHPELFTCLSVHELISLLYVNTMQKLTFLKQCQRGSYLLLFSSYLCTNTICISYEYKALEKIKADLNK